MTDVRISDLLAATTALDTQLIEIDDSGTSKSMALSVLSAWIALTYAKRAKRYPYGDANQTIPSDARVAALTATLTAARTWTLPLASTFAAGETLKIIDEKGGVSSANTLTLAQAAGSSDTLNGQSSKTVASAFAEFNLESDGVSSWTYDVRGLGRGGTGQVATSTADLLQKLGLTDGSGKILTSILPSAIAGAMQFQGVWNASTNSPALASGTGSKGYFYKVGTAGSTALDGISQWNVGDLALFDGTTWDKIDGIASEVLSVAGLTGAITAANLKMVLAIAAADITDSTAVGRALIAASSSAGGRGTLGAAASGANNDITALSGLTTPISKAQGGTGTTGGASPVAGRLAKSSAYTVQASDVGEVIDCTGTFTLGTPAAATAGAGFFFHVKKSDGSGVVTLDPNGAETIDGKATIAVYQEAFLVWTDGTSWYTQGRQKGWISISKVSLTGQTLSALQITDGYGDTELSRVKAEWDGLTLSGSSFINFRVIKSGAAVATTTYGWSYSTYNGSTAAGAASSGAAQVAPLTNTTAGPFTGFLELRNPGSTGTAQPILFEHIAPNGSSYGQIYDSTAAAVQGVQLAPNAGTISAVTYEVMGFRA